MNKVWICAAVVLSACVASGQAYGYGDRNPLLTDDAQVSVYTNNTTGVTSWTPRFNWFRNRIADFCDIFHLGVGVTHENPITGPLTPSFGAHLQVTDYGHLGYVLFGGAVAEWEGRGFGAYSEIRKISGFGPWKNWDVRQSPGAVNFYKDPERSRHWMARMYNEEGFTGESAHLVVHSGDGDRGHTWEDHPRGWHNYAYTGFDLALPIGIPYTPIDSHLGIALRFGVDTSQVFDFILGIVGIDFWHDDLRESDVR